MKGTLSSVNLGGLMRLLLVHDYTGILYLKNEGFTGNLFIKEGNVRSSECEEGGESWKGGDAANRILGLREGSFWFEDGVIPSEEWSDNIASPQNLVMNVYRQGDADEAAKSLPSDTAILALGPAGGNREVDIKLEAQEWNLMIRFDGNRTLAQVRDLCSQSSGDFSKTTAGLLSAGILKRLRFSFPNVHAIAERHMGGAGYSLVEVEMKKIKKSRAHLGMKDVLRLLKDIEVSAGTLVGQGKAGDMAAEMWEAIKR